MSWKVRTEANNKVVFKVNGLKLNGECQLIINNKRIKKYRAGLTGMVSFDVPVNTKVVSIQKIDNQQTEKTDRPEKSHVHQK
jgi:hypothetical protein